MERMSNKFSALLDRSRKIAKETDAKENQAIDVVNNLLEVANTSEKFDVPFLVILKGRKDAVQISGLAHHASSDMVSFIRASEVVDALYIGNALEKTSNGVYSNTPGEESTYWTATDFTTVAGTNTGAEYDLTQSIHCYVKGSENSIMPDLGFNIIIESQDGYRQTLTGVLTFDLDKGESVEFALQPYFLVGGLPVCVPFKLSKATGTLPGAINFAGVRDTNDTKIRLSLLSAKRMATVFRKIY